MLVSAEVASAEGHSPTDALATPTLGERQWSSDTTQTLPLHVREIRIVHDSDES